MLIKLGKTVRVAQQEDAPLGFEMTSLPHHEGNAVHEVQLLLPSGTITEEERAQRRSRAIQSRDEDRWVQDPLGDSQENNSKRSFVTAAISTQPVRTHASRSRQRPLPPVRPSSPLGDLDVEKERDYLRQCAAFDERRQRKRFEQLLKPRSTHAVMRVAIFAWEEPLALLKRSQNTPDRDVHKRNKTLYTAIADKGHLRAVGYPLNQHSKVLQALAQLRQQMPHFSDVVDLVQQSVVLSFARQAPLKIPPVLLLGPPGVGKTHFTQALARALLLPVHSRGFDGDTTASSLTGSDKHWGNSTSGLVFDLLVLGDSASPVVLLDELDKARTSRYADPLSPLHSLLEPVSAKAVRDRSLDVEVDASHIVWIGTANYPKLIPETVRSRFREFVIEPPTGAAALHMAEVIAASVHERMGTALFEAPGRHIAHTLAHLTAREQVQTLEQAFGSAFSEGRRSLQIEDLPRDSLVDDVRYGHRATLQGSPESRRWLH